MNIRDLEDNIEKKKRTTKNLNVLDCEKSTKISKTIDAHTHTHHINMTVCFVAYPLSFRKKRNCK